VKHIRNSIDYGLAFVRFVFGIAGILLSPAKKKIKKLRKKICRALTKPMLVAAMQLADLLIR
jgi:hypothetical protein